MAAQRDFQKQKGRLQAELEAAGQEVIFYPKFHCGLALSSIFGVCVRLIHGITALLQCKVYKKSSLKQSIIISWDYQSILLLLYAFTRCILLWPRQ
jgi:hypothetical protein